MTELGRFALNHITAPRTQFPAFAAIARGLSVANVEIRNDLAGVVIADGTAADRVKQQAEAAGVNIVSINALQRFNLWDEERLRPMRSGAGRRRSCSAR
ncbi:MAG: hypothetical protein M3Y41_17300 [Pseudomonadota bacterium]|nr:hypothetical protein [Pseudomonadota bacterium]